MRYFTVYALFAASLVAGAAGIGMSPHSAAASASPPRPQGSAVAMLALVNRDRHAAGLPSLIFSNRLAHVATLHSIDMASHSYFSHNTRAGVSPFDRLARGGIHYRLAGENLGYDAGMQRLAMLQAIETAMLKSPLHRANLLRAQFTHVGIGVATVHGVMYITEDFTG